MSNPNFTSAIDLKAKVDALKLPKNKDKALEKASTASVRQGLMETFELLGGVESFFRFVQKDERNKRDFYQMWSKLAPKEDGNTGTNIQINIVNYGESQNNDTVQIPSAFIPEGSV